MKIGNLYVDFLAHVCFRFQSKQGKILITDPFFADGYQGVKGHFEKYLSPPDVRIKDIKRCDVIFISHIHGDHFDPHAVQSIQRQSQCAIIAPKDVLDVLKDMGIKGDFLHCAEEGAVFPIGDISISTYCGYDLKYTAKDGSQNKYAITVSTDSTSLFYSGDCHSLPPAVKGMTFDGMLCWPEPDDAKLLALCTGIDAACFILMHGDKFEPGNFICNLDFEEEKRRIERLVPGMNVIIPERVKSIAADRF